MSGFDRAYEEMLEDQGVKPPAVPGEGAAETESETKSEDLKSEDVKSEDLKSEDVKPEVNPPVPYDRFLDVVQQKAVLEARLQNATSDTSESALDRLLAAADEDDNDDPVKPVNQKLEALQERFDAQELRAETVAVKREIAEALVTDTEKLTNEREVAAVLVAKPEMTAKEAVAMVLKHKNELVDRAIAARGLKASGAETKTAPTVHPPAVKGRKPDDNAGPKKWGGWEANYEDAAAYLAQQR